MMVMMMMIVMMMIMVMVRDDDDCDGDGDDDDDCDGDDDGHGDDKIAHNGIKRIQRNEQMIFCLMLKMAWTSMQRHANDFVKYDETKLIMDQQ